MADIVQLGLSLDASKVLKARDKANRAFDSMARSSKKTQQSVSRLQRGFGSLLKGAALFLGLRQLTRGFKAMVDAVKAGEQSALKLDAVLKATGQSAGKTVRQINELSIQMARTTLFNDDEIRETATILLTFRNIQGKVFDDAITATANLATVLGTDLKSAALQLGKALNDPVARLGDLSRSGITFSKAQKDMVRSMTEAGDIAGAQGVIIKELALEFGGAAAGTNVGLFASINSTKKAWDDFLEALGRTSFVQTNVGDFFRGLSIVLQTISPQRDEIGELIRDIVSLQTELARLEGALQTRTRIQKATAIRESIKDKKDEIKVISEAAEAEAEAARAAAAAKKAQDDAERALAVERKSRLEKAQKDAEEWNAKQRVLARAWEKSWGRAIENSQDSFADFFESLLTGGVSSFKEFAQQLLEVWIKLTAQIAATKLFQFALSTSLGKSVTSGGVPDLEDVPKSIPVGPTVPQAAIPAVNVTLNVAAMDSASFQRFAEQNKNIIAGVVGQAVQDSVGLRRAFRGAA